MKVMIADGDWRFARQATEWLEAHAHTVAHYSRAAEAKDKAQHWRPDLAIVSVEAAEDGLLDSLSRLDARPAILLVGRLDQYHQVWRAWQNGGDEVLLTPIMRSEELHLAIVTALENAAGGARTRGAHARASA